MKKLKIRIPNFIIKIGNWLWGLWSNLRWCKAKKVYPLQPVDLISKRDITCSYDVIKFCKEAATRIHSNFTWTEDGIDQLKDAIRPPAQCYSDAINSHLDDDCDGFHSALYHIMSQTSLLELGLKPYLLSITDRYGRGAHCFFIARNIDGKIFIQDYRQSTWFDTADQNEVVSKVKQQYNETYEDALITFYTYDINKGFTIIKNI